jgi:alpha-1,2-mannosyltransferase
MIFSLLFPLLVVPALFPLLLPLCSKVFGGALGWYLTKKTQGRRAQLVALMDEDEERYWRENRADWATEVEDGWQNIDNASGSSENGQTETVSWTGIVGFFHPFWYG